MAALEIRSRDDEESARLADAAVAHWTAVHAALAPIIGGQGVTALYNRSLYLSLKAYPWLEHERSADALGMDLGALRALLVDRKAAEVIEASAALFRLFVDLLGNLVGASLAERLLGALWTIPSAGPAAQDTST